MDDLIVKYKERISALSISDADKEKLTANFYTELQFKLLNAFSDTFTETQKKAVVEAATDEEALKIYFSVLSESIEIPEFLEFMEQTYTNMMTKALSELPDLPAATAK